MCDGRRETVRHNYRGDCRLDLDDFLEERMFNKYINTLLYNDIVDM